VTYLSTAFRSINEPHALLCWDDLTVGAAQRALTSSEMCVRAPVRVPRAHACGKGADRCGALSALSSSARRDATQTPRTACARARACVHVRAGVLGRSALVPPALVGAYRRFVIRNLQLGSEVGLGLPCPLPAVTA
jgi:hypothetical protein